MVASALPVTSAPAAAADPPAPPRPAITVELGADGFSPATVVAVPGQQIEFTNTSGSEQQIVVGSPTAPTVDSGPIPDGGRFVATFDRAITLGLRTDGDPPVLGRLLITQPGLLGEPTALARPAIPDLAPPPTFASDLSPHPDYGLPTSRTTFLVLPTATATIAQVNDAIAAIGGSIVAGMPVLDTITVAIGDAGDFSAWKPALASLRAAPGIADAAPVWQGGTEVTPAPTNLGKPEDTLWWWEDPLTTERGQWGLRAIRAPQAWNTLSTGRESAIDVRTMVDTVVLDAGFGAHPDLPFASIVSSSGADDHGMVDAGIIGASYANAGGPGRTEGVVGVDPLSKLHGVEYGGALTVTTPLLPGDPIRVRTVSDYSASFDWVLGQKRTGGQYPRLGVISASFGVATFPGEIVTNWVNAVAGRTCNPGPADDPADGIGGTVACSPITQDVFVRDMQAVSRVYAQQVLSAAKVLDVVIVKSAGNANDEFCVNGLQILPCPNTLSQTQLPLPAAATNEFIQARNALPGSEPLLVVGAVGPTGQGAFVVGAPITFSQGGPGVDLVAPGQGILSTTVNAPSSSRVRSTPGAAYYERMSGTSQATPHVAGAVAYLRSAFNLSGTEAIDAILSSTATVPFGGQLDMWAAIATLPRGRTALANQNDASVDGNERVQRTIDDAPAAALDWVPTDSMNDRLGRRTADPDLTVDMKDVRAFRDAWLQTCIDGSADLNGGVVAPPTCPGANDIVLDGSAQSWKRDGNLDGCANPGVDGNGASPCGDARSNGQFVYPGEARDNRWDLNGDGYLTPGVSATVPFDSNNQFAPLGTSMTDLDVLATVLSPSAAFEGWTSTQLRSGTLQALMTSADVQVRFDRFGDNGTPFTGTVDIYVDYGNGRLVRQNVYVYPTSNQVMMTVPVGAAGAPLKVWVVGGVRRSPIIEIERALPGQDIVVTPRSGELVVKLGTSQLVPNVGTGVTVELRDATGGLNQGQTIGGEVALSVTGLTPGAPTLLAPTVTLDDAGAASTVLTAGTTTGTGTLRAELTLPSGEKLTGTATFEVVPGITIRYAHRSTLRSYDYASPGTTRWADPLRPDCARIPYVCVDDLKVRTTPAPPTFEVTREGSITMRSNGFTVTEHVDGGVGVIGYDYLWTDVDGSSGSASETFSFSPRASERDRYVDEPIGGRFSYDDSRARYEGIQALSNLGYVTDLSGSRAPFSSPDTGAVTLPRQFLLAPDDSGGNLYIGAVDRPVTFTRPNRSTAWDPFTACARRTVDLSDTPGYEDGSPDPWVPGSQAVERDRVYDPGDIPQPVQQAELVFVTGFAATLATDGTTPADPALPACDGVNPPVASFTISDARGVPLSSGGEVREGEVVRFLDTSTDPDSDIVSHDWSFGDGRGSIVTDPVIGGYADDGLYTITLTVTDLDGNIGTTTQQLSVVNQKPTAEALVPTTTVTAGERATVQFVIDDAGRTDRRALQLQVSGASVSIPTATREAGLVTIDVGVLTTDTTIQALVRDPNNANSGWASVRVIVTPAPVPPPLCPGGPNCPPPPTSISLSAPLDANERAVFNLIDSARRVAGLPPLPISAELNQVANVTARQVAAGTTVGVSAAVAASGYPTTSSVSMRSTQLDSGTVKASLTNGELTMVTDPSAQMLGIARIGLEGGTDTYAIVVGNVLDADVTRPPRGVAPTLDITLPSGGILEGRNVSPVIAVDDPDGDLTAVDIEWGDGTIGGRTHRFRDDGTFTVTVVAIDEQLNRTTTSRTVLVANTAPELALSVVGADGGPPSVGQDATLDISILDWAEADRPLELDVTSSLAGLEFSGPVSSGQRIQFRPTAPGPITVNATLRDADGGVAAPPASTTMPFSFTVAASPSPPAAPPNIAGATAGCAAPVQLRAQAADFLTQANVYRAQQGLATPLVVEPALQAAAQAHLDDLVATRSFSHRGTGNSDPLSRARAAGYTGNVGENLIVGVTTPTGALWGWRMSPPHHTNLLRPWTATGVAVGNSPFGPMWVQVFGDVTRCDGTAPAVVPTVLVPARPGSGMPSVGVLPWPESTTLEASAPQVLTSSVGAPAQATPPPVDVRVVAFTLDRTTAETGQLVQVTNRSMDSGTPVSLRLLLPGGGTSTVAPGASVSLNWFDPGPGSATVVARSMTWPTEAQLSTRVTLTGDAVPPTVTFTSTPSSVPRGGSVRVVATVTDPGGTPLVGRTVRAEASTASAVGTTGVDGIARIDLIVDVPAGTHQIVASVLADDGAPVSVAAPRSVTVTEHVAPVAATTGPYTENLGDAVAFDATPSFATPPATIESAVWDLDGDGAFGDLAALSTSMPFPQVQTLMCGGSCTPGRPYPLRVRVTDSLGATGSASTTVTFARDFGLMVGPQTQTIRPGETTTFTVSAVTTSGFSEPIDLTTTGLPSGVTATFAPTRIAPGESSVLTVRLPAQLPGVSSIPLTVRGTSTGGTVREVSPTVSVVFGLVPVCYGTVSGTIRDSRDGTPLGGATVTATGGPTITGADGSFRFDQLPMSSDNQLGGTWISAVKDGFWSASAYVSYRCGQPEVRDLDLVDVRRVSIRWNVREGQRDPSRPLALTPTDGVPAGAQIRPYARPVQPVGDDGTVLVTYDLSTNNGPISVNATATAPGYVDATSDWIRLDETMVGGEPATGTVLMVQPCSASLLRGKIVGPEGQPAAGATAVIDGITYTGDGYGEFDIDRTFSIDGSTPRWFSAAGTPTDAQFAVGWRPATASFYLQQCDNSLALVRVQLGRVAPPPPPPRLATTVTGTITDSETGLPIPGASLYAYGGSWVTTDANGRYSTEFLADGPVGRDITARIYAQATGYYGETSPTVPARVGTPVEIDLALLPVKTGAVDGVVRDLATGLPIPDAQVRHPNTGVATTVGADGRFRFENVSLGTRNAPSYPYVSASADGYWTRSLPVEVTLGTDGFLDLGLLRECTPATVSGLVVDAVTGLPLDGVAVTGSFTARTTGPDGRFTVADIRMQSQNTPWQQSITATKAGYVTQTQRVNVFCGATVQVVMGPVSDNPGTVTGTITDATTGAPLAGVFVGTDWGDSTTTDANGRYTIDDAPPNGTPNPDDWQVTAQRTFDTAVGALNYAPASRRVVLGPGATEQVDLALTRLSTPNRFPTAVLAEVVDPQAGTPFTLDARASSDPDGDPITFDWDLDADGQYDDATGETTSLTLPAGVTRTVAVRVTDSRLLTGVARRTIVIAPPDTTTSTSTTSTTSTTSSTSTTSTTTTVPPTSSTSTTTSTTSTTSTSTTSTSTSTTSTTSSTTSTTSTTTAPNRMPVAAITGTLDIDEGTSSVLTSASTDPDGDGLSLEWSVDGVTAGTDTGVTVVGERYGTRTVGLRVDDGRGGIDVVEATVRVRNVAPRLVVPSVPGELTQGVAATIDITALDDGIDTFTASTGPASAPVPLTLGPLPVPPTNGSGATTRLVLPTDQLGPASIRVEVCDSEPACAEATVEFTVIAPRPDNLPPTVTLTGPEQVDVDSSIEMVAAATDPDGDDLAFTWYVDGVVQSGSTDRFSFPSGPVGTRTVRVEVTDGHSSQPASATAGVVVRAVGPALTASGPATVKMGEPWPLSLIVTDPIAESVQATIDWGDGTSEPATISASITADGAGAALLDSALQADHTTWHVYGATGDYTVTVDVCGSGERCVRATVPVSVLAQQAPPTTTPPPPTTATTPPTTATPPPTTIVDPPPGPANLPPSQRESTSTTAVPESPTVPIAGLPTTGSESRHSGLIALGFVVLGTALLAATRLRVRRR